MKGSPINANSHRRTKLLLVIGGGVLVLTYAGRVGSTYVYHEDSCASIALAAADMIRQKGVLPRDDLAKQIAQEIRASVIHGSIDSTGRPKDLNGHDFLVEWNTNTVTVSTRFSLLQPIRNREVAEIKTHD